MLAADAFGAYTDWTKTNREIWQSDRFFLDFVNVSGIQSNHNFLQKPDFG